MDGSHNPLGAKVLNEYLTNFNCNKHIILGMMANKDHQDYMKYFKDISSLTTMIFPINQIQSKERFKEQINKLSKCSIQRKYS